MHTMIEAKGLTKTYVNGSLSNTVLRDVSLQVNAGEFVAIMGRSGAGKSTLLYQLSLLDTPSSGMVMLDGIVTDTLSDRERTNFRLERLGYVFQDYALVPELSAVENTAVPLLMQGKSKQAAYQAATDALVRVGLSERINNLPSQLSGGEQQRVSIARAIAHNPSILFADEPTANLDIETSQSVLSIFRELHAAGQTIVMVTHEREYGEMAERIITLADGQIVHKD
jgi:putative ABC transport system ATP-binding protein